MAGYKLKTHRGAAKRIRFTASGKVKRDKAFGSHLLSTKSGKRMRNLTGGATCSHGDTAVLKKMLPFL